VYDRLPVWYG